MREDKSVTLQPIFSVLLKNYYLTIQSLEVQDLFISTLRFGLDTPSWTPIVLISTPEL